MAKGKQAALSAQRRYESAVEHIDPEYEHPYAHPRRQGEADHRGR